MQNNIAFLTSDVSRLLRKRFDVVSRRFGVTGPQWRMLAALRRTPGINQGALAQWLEVEAITAGRMIDRLEKSGMVVRRADPNDRRAWRLFLTDAATPLLDELFVCATEVFEEAQQGFAPAERELLLTLLERVRANLLEDSAPEKPPEAGVSVNRLSPIGLRPALLMKRVRPICPTSVGVVEPGSTTVSWPCALMVICEEFCGIVIVGCTGLPGP